MKYVLIKYKNVKILVSEGVPMQPLLDHLSDIESLQDAVEELYKDMLNVTQQEIAKLETMRTDLTSKIGYKIIGHPFTNQEAELYAYDKQLDFETIELHGNTGKTNAAKDETKESHIHMRTTSSQKAEWVKKAQKSNLKLTEWITKKLNDEL